METSDPTRIDMSNDPRAQRMSGYAAHGMTPFDVPYMTQIDGNLWQGGCENGLVLPKFIKHVVSLYPWERYTVKHELSSFLEVRMYDSTEQTFEQVEELARWVAERVVDAPTLVHCQAGLNRSGLVAARVLMLEGMSADEAIAKLRERRSQACLCNPAFVRHLRELDNG